MYLVAYVHTETITNTVFYTVSAFGGESINSLKQSSSLCYIKGRYLILFKMSTSEMGLL
jgi:hypothetical protein